MQRIRPLTDLINRQGIQKEAVNAINVATQAFIKYFVDRTASVAMHVHNKGGMSHNSIYRLGEEDIASTIQRYEQFRFLQPTLGAVMKLTQQNERKGRSGDDDGGEGDEIEGVEGDADQEMKDDIDEA